jgi:hypothetical protein
VDIRSAKFWQGGFDVLEKLVSELEKLPANAKTKAKPAVKTTVKKTATKKAAKEKLAGKRGKSKKK